MDFLNKVLPQPYITRILLVGTGTQVVIICIFCTEVSFFLKLVFGMDYIFHWKKNQLETSQVQDHLHSNKLTSSYWSCNKVKHFTDTSLALLGDINFCAKKCKYKNKILIDLQATFNILAYFGLWFESDLAS